MKTIVIADDEPNLRTLVRLTVDTPEYRILEAEDGPATLTLARTEHPDLLILDWLMPGMSGLDVASLLRQDSTTANIPIIMLTFKGQEHEKEQIRAIGIFAHLVKPFSPLELIEKVEDVLE
jgi:two-component system, OmpR family, phosphate regulon response regulator PhoB